MLHEFLIAHRGELINRCRARATKRSLLLNHARLEYGVPLFLDQMTQALRHGLPVRAARKLRVAALCDMEIGEAARKHGDELLRLGYAIDQVVHVYGDFFQAVTELASKRNVTISADEFRLLNRCLDNAIAGAVTAYAQGHDAAAAGQVRQTMNERLGSLAHEIRNRLNAVVLALDAIRKGNVGFAGATAGALDRNLGAMRVLVDRSFTEARLESGLPPVTEKIDIEEFTGDIQVVAALEAAARCIGFTVKCAEKGLSVEADRQTLSAALSNLLQNAFKFTRPEGHVTLRVHATDDRVLLDVEDECGGFPPGRAAELFKPFHQRGADRSGLGLGLSITYRGVAACGGRVEVRNVPGTGCVFTIDLPRCMGEKSSEQNQLQLPGMVRGQPERSLVGRLLRQP